MAALLQFTGPRRESMSGWSRTVMVAGTEYFCSVTRGKSVRVPYHKKRGYHWHGAVYLVSGKGGQVWTGRVPGSIGCLGLLDESGVLAMVAQNCLGVALGLVRDPSKHSPACNALGRHGLTCAAP